MSHRFYNNGLEQKRRRCETISIISTETIQRRIGLQSQRERIYRSCTGQHNSLISPLRTSNRYLRLNQRRFQLIISWKDVKRVVVSHFLFFLLIYDVVTFIICLLTLVVEQTESEEGSNEDDVLATKEASEDDETVMKDFETIDPEERYVDVSNFPDNLCSMSVGNPKKYNIAKD